MQRKSAHHYRGVGWSGVIIVQQYTGEWQMGVAGDATNLRGVASETGVVWVVAMGVADDIAIVLQ